MSVRSTRPPTYYDYDLKRSSTHHFADTESIPAYDKEKLERPENDGEEKVVTKEKGRPFAEIGRSTWAVKVRWFMMTIHTILTLATFIIYMITIGTFIPVIVLGTLVVFMLAYIPVVSVLDAKNKSSWLQAAGVEVGYLAVQQAGWIASIILVVWNLITTPSVISTQSTGTQVSRVNNSNSIHGSLFGNTSAPGWAAFLTVALCSIHFCLLLGWMIWIIKVTKRDGGAWSVGVKHMLRS